MTPLEFDILDELYFPQTPAGVAEKLNHGLPQVLEAIEGMMAEGLVKPEEDEDLSVRELAGVRVVATKKGLLAHNGLARQ